MPSPAEKRRTKDRRARVLFLSIVLGKKRGGEPFTKASLLKSPSFWERGTLLEKDTAPAILGGAKEKRDFRRGD